MFYFFNSFIQMSREIALKDETIYYDDHQYACNSPKIPIMKPIQVIIWYTIPKVTTKLKQRTVKKKSIKRIFPKKPKSIVTTNEKVKEQNIDPDLHRIKKKYVEYLNVHPSDKKFTSSVKIQNGKIIELNGENMNNCSHQLEPLLSTIEISELFNNTLFDDYLLSNTDALEFFDSTIFDNVVM